VKGEGRKHRKAARAAAADGDSLNVDETLRSEVLHCCNHVRHIHDAPVACELLAISPAETGAPTMIDVEERTAARSPELRGHAQLALGMTRWAAMDLHDERWPFIHWRAVFGTDGPIEESVPDVPAVAGFRGGSDRPRRL